MIALAFAAQSTTAGIVTAFATVIGSVGGLIIAITGFLAVYRATRETKKVVDETHVIVNQQRTDMQRYQAALTKALKDNGIDIPIDQSLPLVED